VVRRRSRWVARRKKLFCHAHAVVGFEDRGQLEPPEERSDLASFLGSVDLVLESGTFYKSPGYPPTMMR
jgi:hypothetical protein